MQLHETLTKLRDTIPPIFAGTEMDRITGGGYKWRTLQNERSRGDAPASMFVKCGKRKVLIDRDKFLEYWQRKIEATKQAQA